MTSEERRLHIAAVGAEALAQLRQLLFPILIVAVVGGRDAPGRALLYGAAGAVLSLVVAYWRWESARWWVGDDAIHLRQGVFTKTETSVPFARVQAIDTARGPVQRLFGVVALHVQAAGGGRDGELVLRAVTPSDADLVRAAIRTPTAADDRGVTGPSWSLGSRRLVVAALTSGSLGVLVPIVAATAQLGDDVLGADEAGRLVPGGIADALVLVGVVLALAWALSIAGTIVSFAGFAVRRDGDRLLIRRGIIERRDQSVPVARIHAISVVEGLLREPFGLAAVRLETAGYGTEAATTRTLVPVARRSDLDTILATLVPELTNPRPPSQRGQTPPEVRPAHHEDPNPRPPSQRGQTLLGGLEGAPGRSVRRFVLPLVMAGAVPAGALVAGFGVDALPALVLPLAGAVVGFGRFRAAGWRLAEGRLVLRSRRLARTTVVADARRVQLVRASATAFQRRGGLASFGVGISSGRAVGVPHLERHTVDGLVDDVSALAR